jgi:hypothetical protein
VTRTREREQQLDGIAIAVGGTEQDVRVQEQAHVTSS